MPAWRMHAPHITEHGKNHYRMTARKKLQRKCSRWRGPVVQDVAENVGWQNRSGKGQGDFDRRRFDESKPSDRSDPPRSIPVEMLSLGCDGPLISRFYGVTLSAVRHPESGGYTDCQRTDSDSD